MSEKTEQPTPKRLREARQKGQVAKSREVASAAGITGLFLLIWIAWDFFVDNLKELVLLPSRFYGAAFDEAFKSVLDAVLIKLVILSLPPLVTAMILAALANFFQVGALFAFEPIKPDLKKINPAQAIKKIFSLNNLVELIKSILKIIFLSVLLYIVIKEAIDPLIKIPYWGLPGLNRVLPPILKKIVIYSSAAFMIVAAADYFFQKHQHIKQLKMTKDEVKREYKEMEGDPIIKSKRRQLHKEMAMNDMKRLSLMIINYRL